MNIYLSFSMIIVISGMSCSGVMDGQANSSAPSEQTDIFKTLTSVMEWGITTATRNKAEALDWLEAENKKCCFPSKKNRERKARIRQFICTGRAGLIPSSEQEDALQWIRQKWLAEQSFWDEYETICKNK